MGIKLVFHSGRKSIKNLYLKDRTEFTYLSENLFKTQLEVKKVIQLMYLGSPADPELPP